MPNRALPRWLLVAALAGPLPSQQPTAPDAPPALVPAGTIDAAIDPAHTVVVAPANPKVAEYAVRLPFRFAEGSVEIAGRTFRGERLRVICALKNPHDPERRGVLHCAARAADLVDCGSRPVATKCGRRSATCAAQQSSRSATVRDHRFASISADAPEPTSNSRPARVKNRTRPPWRRTVDLPAVMTRDEVLACLAAHGEELHAMGVRWLGLFGSFARDEAHPQSDVDLLVDLDRVTFDRFMDVKLRLEDLLGRRVDLVLRDSLKPRIRDRILREVIRAA